MACFFCSSKKNQGIVLIREIFTIKFSIKNSVILPEHSASISAKYRLSKINYLETIDEESESTGSLKSIFRKYLIAVTIISVITVIFFGFGKNIFEPDKYESLKSGLADFFNTRFLIYLTVGFIAQMIDGSLGMAYGVSSTTFLMSAGVSPAVASASVHVAEVFTTGISGMSHWHFGNVDKKLFYRLSLPGAIGAALGAYILTSIDGKFIKPYVSVYLAVMGVIIILKAFKKSIHFRHPERVTLLALAGGFLDNIGGGGWGPVVTTTLLGSGSKPRMTIGSVNASEFFVSLTGASVFTLFIGIQGWNVIAGLIFGGILAAPLGAYLCSRINTKAIMIMVGIVIILLSIRTIILSL